MLKLKDVKTAEIVMVAGCLFCGRECERIERDDLVHAETCKNPTAIHRGPKPSHYGPDKFLIIRIVP